MGALRRLVRACPWLHVHTGVWIRVSVCPRVRVSLFLVTEAAPLGALRGRGAGGRWRGGAQRAGLGARVLRARQERAAEGGARGSLRGCGVCALAWSHLFLPTFLPPALSFPRVSSSSRPPTAFRFHRCCLAAASFRCHCPYLFLVLLPVSSSFSLSFSQFLYSLHECSFGDVSTLVCSLHSPAPHLYSTFSYLVHHFLPN